MRLLCGDDVLCHLVAADVQYLVFSCAAEERSVTLYCVDSSHQEVWFHSIYSLGYIRWDTYLLRKYSRCIGLPQ
jgi:hypothetical protein